MYRLNFSDKLALNEAGHIIVNDVWLIGCYACKNLDSLNVTNNIDTKEIIVTCKECAEVLARTVLVDAVYCHGCNDSCENCTRILSEGLVLSNRKFFDCEGCDAFSVDEFGDGYCNIDGELVEELNECPEMEEPICDDCGNVADECVCEYCNSCGCPEYDCFCKFCEVCGEEISYCECLEENYEC